jgi:sporulation protein YlmC with PRC-barrel domain
MVRKLFATTAVAALMTGGAIAADISLDARAQTANETEQQTTLTGDFQPSADQILASEFIGMQIHSGAADDAEQIGEVQDVVMSPDGTAEAVIVDVGGFLGMGEKRVAISFDQIEWTQRDGEDWLSATFDRQALENAPEFQASALQEGEMQTDQQAAEGEMDTPEEVAEDGAQKDDARMTEAVPADDQQLEAEGETVLEDETQTGGQTAESEMPAEDQEGVIAQTDEGADTEEGLAEAPADEPGVLEAEEQDGAADQMQAGVAREGMSIVQAGDISAEELIGTTVYGANDDNIGEIGDVVLSDDQEVIAYVINVGGFLGLGEKPVALAAENLEVYTDEGGAYSIYSSFTEEQLENQPAFDEEAFAADPDSFLLRDEGAGRAE